MVEKNDKLGVKKIFFFLNLDFYRAGGTEMFILTICADIVYPPGEKSSLFTHFCSNKRFFDVYNVEHPSQT